MTSGRLSTLLPLTLLLLLWSVIIVVINPIGEFMINDDWSFTLVVEDLLTNKTFTTTGWAGGPAALVHILWGTLWSLIFGFSVSALRCATLFLAICTSIALLILLKDRFRSSWIVLLYTLTLTVNPLFLSQSFTFMTDITFVAMVVVALLFISWGIEKNHYPLLITGFFFSLLATLTRQLGLAIPLAFLVTVFLHPPLKTMSRRHLSLVAVLVGIVPWLSCELWLATLETSVANHPVVQRIFAYPVEKGVFDYGIFLLSQAGVIWLYCGFFLSPLLIIHQNKLRSIHPLRKLIILITFFFCLFELAIILGYISPPTGFYKNIIYNFGIGPILLKDNYLLGITRNVSLPPPIFYMVIWYATISALALGYLLVRSIRQLIVTVPPNHATGLSFRGLLCLICLIIYSGTILLTGFHDRYLIPLMVFLIVWLADHQTPSFEAQKSMLIATSIVLFIGLLSTLSIRDFMTIKHSQYQATHDILNERDLSPCEIDGGFEHNGYHCSNQKKPTVTGTYSWWWVTQEKYLVSLGPMADYHVVHQVPYRLILGYDGAIHILQPINPGK
ncbi:MAG: hypothetical protein D6B25_08435 [Desulfobulbaceae bacterium]|nr:MAG: hypothetical protein D6B25_08435 [Desulfobulbaceae bacterium]